MTASSAGHGWKMTVASVTVIVKEGSSGVFGEGIGDSSGWGKEHWRQRREEEARTTLMALLAAASPRFVDGRQQRQYYNRGGYSYVGDRWEQWQQQQGRMAMEALQRCETGRAMAAVLWLRGLKAVDEADGNSGKKRRKMRVVAGV
ncbi:hypothetical protein GW17_00053439 [Ensete ventricosum]|nr:hypothetical protein GW17_00053439 [Ensete ventricosum]